MQDADRTATDEGGRRVARSCRWLRLPGYMGDGLDWARYGDSGAGVTIDLAAGTGFGSDAEGDTQSGDNGVNMIRGGGGDVIRGGGGDVIRGGGNDILKGHGGADIFVFGAGDVILLTGIDSGLLDADLFDFV